MADELWSHYTRKEFLDRTHQELVDVLSDFKESILKLLHAAPSHVFARFVWYLSEQDRRFFEEHSENPGLARRDRIEECMRRLYTWSVVLTGGVAHKALSAEKHFLDTTVRRITRLIISNANRWAAGSGGGMGFRVAETFESAQAMLNVSPDTDLDANCLETWFTETGLKELPWYTFCWDIEEEKGRLSRLIEDANDGSTDHMYNREYWACYLFPELLVANFTKNLVPKHTHYVVELHYFLRTLATIQKERFFDDDGGMNDSSDSEAKWGLLFMWRTIKAEIERQSIFVWDPTAATEMLVQFTKFTNEGSVAVTDMLGEVERLCGISEELSKQVDYALVVELARPAPTRKEGSSGETSPVQEVGGKPVRRGWNAVAQTFRTAINVYNDDDSRPCPEGGEPFELEYNKA
ncbi:hypothetical protein BJ508DRAFT_366839 [Ascobolus immersus RN42]|uniref:Uncharacterized protein n=1 Tax=Ascobolus immersus RN42 TaxID=1160509 RepID=A0A3N4HGM2_ASCIM|nr:hypothetical protein BJ508DRAFT_366839 [Ascobolus immersus RN42]